MRKLTGIAVSASVVFALLFHGVAQAQYPAPIGSVQAQASTTAAAVGENVTITCIATSATGAPVPGASCTFAIESEPGLNASIGSKVTTRTTDASGRAFATLNTGDAAGVISVLVTTSTNLSSRVLVSVTGGAGGSAPGGGALPPATGIDQGGTIILPPSTGDGGLVGASGTSAATAAGMLFVGLFAAATMTLAIRTSRTNGN